MKEKGYASPAFSHWQLARVSCVSRLPTRPLDRGGYSHAGAPTAIRRRALPRASGAYGKWYIRAAFPPAILTFSSSVHSARISPRICCVRGKVDSTWG
jgi:hypothetical protein